MAERCTLEHEGERIFAKPIERAVLRDSRLSFAARGLFCFLWDLPTGWEANSRHLAVMSPKGRGAVLTLLRELQTIGAMRIAPKRNENKKLAGRVWIVRAPYLWAKEAAITTRSEFPERDSRKPRQSKNSTVEKPSQKVLQLEGSTNLRVSQAPEDREAKRKGDELLATMAKKRHAKNATAR